MGRLLLIQNPVAGGGKGAGAIRREIRDLRRQGHFVEVVTTTRSGEARILARGLVSRFDRIAAVGGDGTVSEVAAGLFESGFRRPLIVVPTGTANDFATSALHGETVEQALQEAFTAPAIPIDLGFAGETPFVNGVSAGFAAEASEAASPELKARLGPLAYLASGVVHLGAARVFHLRVEGGGDPWEGDALYFTVANGPTVGGGSRVAPIARVDDGLLDLTVLPVLPPAQLPGALLALRNGTEHPALVRRQAPSFGFSSDRLLALACDGEILRADSLSFRVEPAALWVGVHRPSAALSRGHPDEGNEVSQDIR